MANPVWALGRFGLVYCKNESTYGVAPTFAATDAVRNTALSLPYNAQNLRKSAARYADPGLHAMFRGRRIASFDIKSLLYPSGTLNTLPEANTLLANSFGQAPTNVTLSTTVASGAGVSGAVVASATGLAANQPIQITMLGGANPGVYLRWLSPSYAGGTTLTWSPALPSTCAVSDTIKGTAGYALATNNVPTSMDIAHYPQSPGNWYTREMLGCIANKLAFMVDSNLEPSIQVSGPAAAFATSPQSQPGAFTTVGAENGIPSGLTGYFQYGSTLYQIEKLQLDIDNAMDVQNTALGTAFGTAPFRKGKRAVTLKIDAKVSTDLTLWTPSIAPGPAAPTEGTLMVQIGVTATQIIGLYCPRVIFNASPSVSDNDETNQWSYSLTALTTTANDECFLAFA